MNRIHTYAVKCDNPQCKNGFVDNPEQPVCQNCGGSGYIQIPEMPTMAFAIRLCAAAFMIVCVVAIAFMIAIYHTHH